MTKIPIIVVIGPTASGKSEMAVKIAKKQAGEIISVDSRQIYRGMDIGSGKIDGKIDLKTGQYTYKGIPHFGIDIANPKRQYSVVKFQNYAQKVIREISDRSKLPILCGGTAHWVDAVVFNQKFPEVRADLKLRIKLNSLTAKNLFTKLAKLDPARAQNIDPQNKRRLVRAIEIVTVSGKPVPEIKSTSNHEAKWIGLKTSPEQLQQNISLRLKQRIKQGMFDEVKDLKNSGISWNRLENFGLEYKYCSLYLQGKMTREASIEKLEIEIRKFAKRQMTWWKRNKEIKWIEV